MTRISSFPLNPAAFQVLQTKRRAWLNARRAARKAGTSREVLDKLAIKSCAQREYGQAFLSALRLTLDDLRTAPNLSSFVRVLDSISAKLSQVSGGTSTKLIWVIGFMGEPQSELSPDFELRTSVSAKTEDGRSIRCKVSIINPHWTSFIIALDSDLTAEISMIDDALSAIVDALEKAATAWVEKYPLPSEPRHEIQKPGGSQ